MQSNSNIVVLTPVDEVQVEVITEVRNRYNLVRSLLDISLLLFAILRLIELYIASVQHILLIFCSKS